MVILLTIFHVLVCFFLIVVVLLQSGKAADLAGAFGGMGSQTAFGPRGAATVLSKATTVAAVIFMLTSLSLAIIAARGTGGGRTVLEDHKPTQTRTAPAQTPAAPPAAPGQPVGAGQPVQVDFSQIPPAGQAPAQAPTSQPKPAPAQPQK
ncbi:MAG: preprotein translocase subunit SecG [Bryobacteraceae bacterium]|nr:preprotein translocase subunit SecG [Bryobacteraceae bacterium]